LAFRCAERSYTPIMCAFAPVCPSRIWSGGLAHRAARRAFSAFSAAAFEASAAAASLLEVHVRLGSTFHSTRS